MIKLKMTNKKWKKLQIIARKVIKAIKIIRKMIIITINNIKIIITMKLNMNSFKDSNNKIQININNTIKIFSIKKVPQNIYK